MATTNWVITTSSGVNVRYIIKNTGTSIVFDAFGFGNSFVANNLSKDEAINLRNVLDIAIEEFDLKKDNE